MTFIIVCIAGFLAYRLYQTSKQKQIAYNRYMEDRVVAGNAPNYMVGPDGSKHPMWCPNCGRNL